MMFADLQSAVADRLTAIRAEPGLHALPIVTEVKGSLDTDIARRLMQSAVGLVVSTPSFERGIRPGEIKVDVAVVLVENVMANRGDHGTRRTAIEIAEILYGTLDRWSPGAGWAPLDLVSHALRDGDEDAKVLIYVTLFRTRAIVKVTP